MIPPPGLHGWLSRLLPDEVVHSVQNVETRLVYVEDAPIEVDTSWSRDEGDGYGDVDLVDDDEWLDPDDHACAEVRITYLARETVQVKTPHPDNPDVIVVHDASYQKFTPRVAIVEGEALASLLRHLLRRSA